MIKSCRLSERPEFEELSERAQNVYNYSNGYGGLKGVVKNPREIREKFGATDDDVRALLQKGYMLALPGGRALVVHCPFLRQYIQEYVEQNGHQPTIEEINDYL